MILVSVITTSYLGHGKATIVETTVHAHDNMGEIDMHLLCQFGP
jgi:hypothetical protein